MSTAIGRAISTEDAARLRTELDRPEAVLRVGSQTVVMSESLRQAIIRVVDELAAGNDVAVHRVDPFLTTGQAAALLHVSRPTVVKLCRDGILEFEQPGTHRRISLESIKRFIETSDSRRAAGLAEFAQTGTEDDDQIVSTR
ncbi:MAG TPA: helix-turn-helix domain-containing protein [Dermatophilaceae bacterium]|nr:helix-turn-helix domain-containing protein [Dermatophilaceae bacterium]